LNRPPTLASVASIHPSTSENLPSTLAPHLLQLSLLRSSSCALIPAGQFCELSQHFLFACVLPGYSLLHSTYGTVPGYTSSPLQRFRLPGIFPPCSLADDLSQNPPSSPALPGLKTPQPQPFPLLTLSLRFCRRTILWRPNDCPPQSAPTRRPSLLSASPTCIPPRPPLTNTAPVLHRDCPGLALEARMTGQGGRL
jgi:hypothetical protein